MDDRGANNRKTPTSTPSGRDTASMTSESDKRTVTGLAARELADLARAGFILVRQPGTEISFMIRHSSDKPGTLLRTLGSGDKVDSNPDPSQSHVIQHEVVDEDFSETITASMNGQSFIALTALSQDQATDNPPQEDSDVPSWKASLPPNPTFLYDHAQAFEGLIILSETDTTPSQDDARRVSELIQEISYIACDAELPVISMTFPAQVPKEATELELPDWPSPHGLALRFAFALLSPNAQRRLELAERVSRVCKDYCVKLALVDAGPGTRPGNWIPVLKEEVEHKKSESIGTLLPMTFVGPARVGSTHAITRFINQWRVVGVSGCSIVSLNDLAFIHLQVCVSESPGGESTEGSGRRDLGELIELCKQQSESSERLQLPLSAVLDSLTNNTATSTEQETGTDIESDLLLRTAGYRGYFGHPVTFDIGDMHSEGEVGIWVSWLTLRGKDVLATPLQELQKSFKDLFEESNSPKMYNITYLVCREVSGGRLRAIGKLALAKETKIRLGADYPRDSSVPEDLPSQVCRRLEERWRTRLEHENFGAIELTVSWREYWLGHWSAPV